MKKTWPLLLCLLLVFSAAAPSAAAPKNLNVNVVLDQPLTPQLEKELKALGKIGQRIDELNALSMSIKAENLPKLLALDFVEAANEDAYRSVGPETQSLSDILASYGVSTWNLDAINVTDPAEGRVVDQTGEGVYVAVLDTGLISQWREFFPQEQILTQYARSFGGGGSANAEVSEQPNKWEQDVNSHGTHVTSTILGFVVDGRLPVNGVAPKAKIIPVKVLNQNGSGSSFVVAQGITYIAELKEELNVPMVINMSLGGSVLDAVEKAAVDYAIEKGVILVAAAGNEGERGMGYPAAYTPVISVAAAGWTGEWLGGGGWWAGDVPEEYSPEDYYITDFSSRDLINSDDPMVNHDLDVAAPGSWIVGPYAVNSGKYNYYFLGGTSMACPHVAGAVALMLEKDAALSSAAAEVLLEETAQPLGIGPRTIYTSAGVPSTVNWGTNATGHGLMNVADLLGSME